MNRDFGNANAVKIGGGVAGGINDTVSRLHGLNTSEINRQSGAFNGPNGNPCNPFISDSYLFLNSAANESNNFGNQSSTADLNGVYNNIYPS